MDGIRIRGNLISESALEETFATSGGPGGQHANRNETAVRLTLDVAESGLPEDLIVRIQRELGFTVEVTAMDSRSQFRNRALARRRLREKLETALVDRAPRKQTRPTRASKKRRIAAKRARSEKKRLRKRPDLDS